MLTGTESQTEATREHSTGLLNRVPAGQYFLCHDGKMFRDTKDLAEGLIAMSDLTFSYHVNGEKNDFSLWARDVIKDGKLAADLSEATTRLEAIGVVVSRLVLLSGRFSW